MSSGYEMTIFLPCDPRDATSMARAMAVIERIRTSDFMDGSSLEGPTWRPAPRKPRAKSNGQMEGEQPLPLGDASVGKSDGPAGNDTPQAQAKQEDNLRIPGFIAR